MEQDNREELAEDLVETPVAEEHGAEVEAESQEPIAEGGQGEPQPIDLTQSDEFRKWQAEADRRAEAERRERIRLQQELEELQRQSAEAFLRDADPEQAAAFYQGELTKTRQAMAKQRQQQELINEVYTELADMGVSQDQYHLLDWADEINERAALKVIKSAAKLQLQQLSHTREESQKEAKAMAREARQEAIKETGAARVSADAGNTAGRSLAAEYAREKKAIRSEYRQGSDAMIRALTKLKQTYRAKGLEV